MGCKEPEKRARLQVGVEEFLIQSVEVLEVLVLAVQALHDPHTGDVLIVLAVDHGNGAPDTHKGVPGKALPIRQDEEEWRDDPQVDQGQLPVGEQHGDDDPRQAEEVCQGRHQQLKRLLQLHDIALAARHDSSDRGAVKEGGRQGLEMIE